MKIGHAQLPFRAIHDALVGVDVAWDALDWRDIPDHLLTMVRAHWLYRVETEYRSIQVMTRFMSEVLAAGDPLEVYAGIADAIVDEIRHTALCVGVVERLGVAPQTPDPVALIDPPGFTELVPAQRALGTALSMLAVSETLSVALIEDLRARATHPTIRQVLERTLADEDTHDAFGWAYVEASLARFSGSAHEYARLVVEATIEPHLEECEATLARLDPALHELALHPEPELAAWGIMGDARQALVKLATWKQRIRPRLARLGLAAPGG